MLKIILKNIINLIKFMIIIMAGCIIYTLFIDYIMFELFPDMSIYLEWSILGIVLLLIGYKLKYIKFSKTDKIQNIISIIFIILSILWICFSEHFSLAFCLGYTLYYFDR